MIPYDKLTYEQIKANAEGWSALELIAIEHLAGFSRDWAFTQLVTLKQAEQYAGIKGYSERWVMRWAGKK